MGKSSLRRVHWAVTIPGGVDESKPTDQAGVKHEFGGALFSIHVGPLEMPDDKTDFPHRHVLVSGPTAITRTKCLAALSDYLGGQVADTYAQPIDTNTRTYLAYAWKTMGVRKRKQEESLDAAIKRVKASGHQVTLNRLEEDLVVNEGVHFVSQNAQLIKTAARMPGVLNDRKVIEVSLDPAQNMLDTCRCIQIFKDNIRSMVHKNGIETTWIKLNDATRDQQVAYIVAYSLLPSLFFRLKDGCASLYFWGEPNTGKSYLFDGNNSFRKVPLDAPGVSRFKLEGSQTAFLLDDVKNDVIDKPDNSATLRQLSLGTEARLKTFGDTQTAKAFVFVTSNDKPNYLCPIGEPPSDVSDAEQWKTNQMTNNAAWKRRFVALQFTDMLDVDEEFEIQWDHDSALFAVAMAIKVCLNEMSEPCRVALQCYANQLSRYETDEMKMLAEKYVVSHAPTDT